MSDRLAQAIELATSSHRGQIDKSGKPYILHPLRVMNAVLAEGHSEDVAIAAVLHDVVEDTDTTIDEIYKLFGGTVAETVDALTRREGESYNTYVKRVLDFRRATIVKLYDIFDNIDIHRLVRDMDYSKYFGTLSKIYKRLQDGQLD